MGNFSLKVEKFINVFIEQNGYVKVLEGLQVPASRPVCLLNVRPSLLLRAHTCPLVQAELCSPTQIRWRPNAQNLRI